MRIRECLAPTLLLGAVLAVSACTSDEEKARRDEERMVELAKADAQAESLFVHDSVALAASFSLDTVHMLLRVPPGGEFVDTLLPPGQFYVRSPRGARCLLDSARAVHIAPGDTLRCQWETPGAAK